MTGLRLVLVTRRYWPLVGGAEMVIANLAAELHRQGDAPVVLTAQWDSQWPRELVHRDVPVYRLPQPAQRGWGTWRYMTALGSWLRGHRGQYDAVCVSMLKHDAYTAVGSLRGSSIPVILRAEGGGPSGDCHWHLTARFGRRIRRRCQEADAVVAASRAVERELLAAGFSRQRVHHVPNGVAVCEPRDALRRRAARRAMAEANADLSVAEQTPVVVYTGRLHRAKGLSELVDAWRMVAAWRPDARLWIVGEGPERESLFQQIRDADLDGRVLLPGAFDDVDELLCAADVFVLPSHAEGLSLSLLEAMAAGLPVVATDIPGNDQLVTHDQTGLLVPPGRADQIAAAVRRVLSQPQQAAQLARNAFELVRAQYSVQRMAQDHCRLLHDLITAKARPAR